MRNLPNRKAPATKAHLAQSAGLLWGILIEIGPAVGWRARPPMVGWRWKTGAFQQSNLGIENPLYEISHLQIMFIDFPIKMPRLMGISQPHLISRGFFSIPSSPGGRAQARLRSRHNTISCAGFSNSSRSEFFNEFFVEIDGNGWKWCICPMKP